MHVFQFLGRKCGHFAEIYDIKSVSRDNSFSLSVYILHTLCVQISGSQRGRGVPGALKFLLWSPEPDHFIAWSPDTFLAVEPGAQRNFARSPEPSIFKFDHSSSQIASILDYCLFVFVCLCVLTGIKKQNLKRAQYIIACVAWRFGSV